HAMQGGIGNNVPIVDAVSAYACYQAYHEAVLQGLVTSCHDLSDGGLAVAAAESAFAGGLGIAIDLSRVPWKGGEDGWRDEALLFSESASRLLVTVSRKHAEAFESVMGENCLARIGVVTVEPLLDIEGIGGNTVIKADLAALKEAWQSTLREL
ncbi:MAG: phosphoribosylformylglycinamidine synthase, partial [Deltaproteobacteria bacterium]|nr:phosphoribosylformylglycinamidine synthase [Deltaproteobacteria bacterium]